MILSTQELTPFRKVTDPRNLQRETAEWIDPLARSGRSGDFFAHVGDISLNPFAALRAHLQLVGGKALSDLKTLGELQRAHPSQRIELTGNNAGRLAEIARASGQIDVIAQVSFDEWAQRARTLAHIVRRELRNAFRATPAVTASCDVLMLPRMAAHLADLLPVASALKSRGRNVLFAADTLIERCQETGVPTTRLCVGDWRTALKLWVALVKVARKVQEQQYTTPEAKVLQWVLTREVMEQAIGLAQIAVGVDALLKRHRPKLVIVGNPYVLEGYTAAVIAQERGVPTVAFEHGTIFANDPVWRDVRVDHMFVRGTPGHRALIANQLAPERIKIVGAPRLDAMISRVNVQRPKRVLVASSGGGDQVSVDEHERFVSTVFEAASETPEIEWVVKLHPKDKPELYAARAHAFPKARVSVRTSNPDRAGVEIYDYLAESSVVVTVLSSTALDAMAVDVPVISVLLDAEVTRTRRERVEFLARETVVCVSSSKELSQAVLRLVNHGADAATEANARKYADEQFHFRGRASEHSAEEIIALCGKNSSAPKS